MANICIIMDKDGSKKAIMFNKAEGWNMDIGGKNVPVCILQKQGGSI